MKVAGYNNFDNFSALSQLLGKNSKIWSITFLAFIGGVFMQNFSPLALKLRDEIENDEQIYCKNANSPLEDKNFKNCRAFYCSQRM